MMTGRWLLAGLLAAMAVCLPALAGGPIETNIFAVQGVDVDVTSTDATAAKNQALMDVQVKAFYQLVQRLGTPKLLDEVRARFKPEDIAPYLRSLSIEQETSAPGRYIGRFTVRFLPDKTEKFFRDYGIRVPTRQADPILVLPVYRDADANKLWEDTPWRKAWLDLKGEQGIVPLIVPLGDLEDTETLTVEDALHDDPIRLEALRKRYGTPGLLIAQAQPADGGRLHVYIEGNTELGKVTFNKMFKPAPGQSAEAAMPAAVQEFQQAVLDIYKEREAKLAANEQAQGATPHSMSVSVPFSSPREWNAIRSRILTTPNVVGVDLSTLSTDGAVIQLVFNRSVEELQGNMQRVGLNLTQFGEIWVIQSL
jgi:hypothetical protein